MRLDDMNPEELTSLYMTPQLQGAVIQWIACIRGHDQSGKSHWLGAAIETAINTIAELPFDSAVLDGEETSSPSEVMAVIAFDMIKAGIIPSYKEEE